MCRAWTIRSTAATVRHDDDDEQRDPVLEGARRVLQRDDGRDEEGDGHEHDAARRRGLGAVSGRLGEGAHRRVQRHRARRHERQRVGEVEETARHADQIDVGEHVQRVPDEHARHGGEQEPERRDAVLFGAEGDPHRHHHEEDRHGRIAREHQSDGERRVVVEQHGVDDVDPRHRQDGQRRDDRVEDDPEVPLAARGRGRARSRAGPPRPGRSRAATTGRARANGWR